MKKLVSWYKKKDKELETHFTAGLLQINFVTNALILLAFYIYLVISQSLYAIKDPFNLVFGRSLPSPWRSFLTV